VGKAIGKFAFSNHLPHLTKGVAAPAPSSPHFNGKFQHYQRGLQDLKQLRGQNSLREFTVSVAPP